MNSNLCINQEFGDASRIYAMPKIVTDECWFSDEFITEFMEEQQQIKKLPEITSMKSCTDKNEELTKQIAAKNEKIERLEYELEALACQDDF